jgi:endonuclease/exonuclease/phosphatase family metal-dependent hydrolase
MRLVSYNILDGGEGRADPLAEVILAQKPDVVALVECDNIDVLNRIASRLSMDFVHAQGKKHAAAILSRWTIRDSINHAALTKKIANSFVEATIVDPTRREWIVAATHLPAHALEKDETGREKELKFILKSLAEHREQERPHILCGDFNSNAPSQQIDPEKCKPATRKEWKANGGKVPRRVVQQLLDCGYVDSIRAINPEYADRTGTFTTQFPGQRVDYIFACGLAPSAVQSAWIEQDRLAKYASDHFPIGVEIA